jgi:hypothetical protein
MVRSFYNAVASLSKEQKSPSKMNGAGLGLRSGLFLAFTSSVGHEWFAKVRRDIFTNRCRNLFEHPLLCVRVELVEGIHIFNPKMRRIVHVCINDPLFEVVVRHGAGDRKREKVTFFKEKREKAIALEASIFEMQFFAGSVWIIHPDLMGFSVFPSTYFAGTFGDAFKQAREERVEEQVVMIEVKIVVGMFDDLKREYLYHVFLLFDSL